MEATNPPAGWYTDPEDPTLDRMWLGATWGDQRRPHQPAPTQPPPPTGPPASPLTHYPDATSQQPPSSAAWAVAVTLVLVVVGLVVGYQPVSLLTGSGILYVGLAITASGAVLAFVMRLRTWLKVVALLAAILVIANIATTEHELSQKRQQIKNELSNLGG